MIHISQNDHVGRAVSWLLFGVAGGLMLDLCAKEILRTYSLQEFVFVRSSIAAVVFLALTPKMLGGLRSLRTQRWRWHALRTVLAVIVMFGFFYGLSRMPLVNALTLGFTAPLMMTALSVPFLGEHVGRRRWIAVTVGFAGVLVMLRPGNNEFTFASAAILIAAFGYACQAISARYLATTESTLSLSIYVVIGPLLVSGVLLNDGNWSTPDVPGWILLTGAGVSSAIAWLGMINGYRGAPTAVLAPLEYTALIGGAIAGYLIWGEIPDRWVVVGALIIVFSGLYVVFRELKAASEA